ncbi:hypothetical protein RI129_000624 [Pyrocoelia pectoralis]|uniref:Acyltransferase n=1 Tax=Pyrocoelia pectoralis TaxID=417401 RepID=A0AAN7ZJF7_9COLE
MGICELLKRHLEMFAAGSLFLTLCLGPLVGLLTTGYLLLYSSYRFFVLLYVIWIYFFDLNTCDRGGRRMKWVRRLPWFKYVRNYFPLSLEKTSEVSLNSTRNYILCSFPHGIFPLSAFTAFATEACGFNKLFPKFTPYGITLKIGFLSPFYREFLYSLGLCSANSESIKWLLNKKEGGNLVFISVGGAAEAMYSKPQQYILVLKNRKGFVKLALETGCPLVPVLSFGETDVFDQVDNPKGSLLRAVQEWVKKYMGYVPIIPKGRGFFQDSFGLVPRQKPITTLVGPPLEVYKIENPSSEDISTLHQRFVDHLVAFFENHKHKYIDNADEIKLVII